MAKTNDFIIRMATPSDASQLVAIYRPYVEQTVITFEYEVPTIYEFQQRISQTLLRYPYLVATDDTGKIYGYAYAGKFKTRAAYDWSAEVSVYLDQQCQGRGIGSALYQGLEQILAAQHVYQLLACITLDNQESVLFHEGMGYTTVGSFSKVGFKHECWHDIVWMQKQLNELPVQPLRFIPLSKLSEWIK